MNRYESAFFGTVGNFQDICDSQTHTDRVSEKCLQPRLFMFCCLESSVLSFLPLLFYYYYYYFVRLVKCALGRVQEITTRSSLDGRSINGQSGMWVISYIKYTISKRWKIFNDGLVSLFNGILTFVGYLMPKLFS